MHMTENSNTGNFGRQRFSLHGVDLTKFDGGGARDQEVSPSTPRPPHRAARSLPAAGRGQCCSASWGMARSETNVGWTGAQKEALFNDGFLVLRQAVQPELVTAARDAMQSGGGGG